MARACHTPVESLPGGVLLMGENAFLGYIIDVAKRGGWRVWHVPMPVRPIPGGGMVPEPRARGLCDLIMFHDNPPRLILAEVKGVDGKLSDEQKEFLRLGRGVVQETRKVLNAAGYTDACPIGVYVWRPGVEQLIEAVLLSKVLVA